LILAILFRSRERALTHREQSQTRPEQLNGQLKSEVNENTEDLISANRLLSGIIESQAGVIAIIGKEGEIRHSNQAWDEHWSKNILTIGSCRDKNCVEVCDLSFSTREGINTVSSPTIQRVLSGESQFETFNYGCYLGNDER
jgi:hypothetical protein